MTDQQKQQVESEAERYADNFSNSLPPNMIPSPKTIVTAFIDGFKYRDGMEGDSGLSSTVISLIIEAYKCLNLSIPYYAYGDNEAACQMATAINDCREILSSAMDEVSAESVPTPDSEVKRLREALLSAVDVIKGWHCADEVWDIYYNNAPEMKPIREALNPQP